MVIHFMLIAKPSLAGTVYEVSSANGKQFFLDENRSCAWNEHLNAGMSIISSSKRIEFCWGWGTKDNKRFAIIFTPTREFSEIILDEKLNNLIVKEADKSVLHNPTTIVTIAEKPLNQKIYISRMTCRLKSRVSMTAKS